MKKRSKIGLGIFLGILGVIVIAVVAVAVLLFGGPTFRPPQFTQQDMESVTQKLPVMRQLDGLSSGGMLAEPEHGVIGFSEGELNALLSVNSANTANYLNANVPREILPDAGMISIPADGISAAVRNDRLVLYLKLGDCSSLTGNATIDGYLTGSVITAVFKGNGKIQLESFRLNNLDAGMVPDFIAENIPGYSGGGLVEFINSKCADLLNGIFTDIFMAQDIESIDILDSTVTVEGGFYTRVVPSCAIE